MKRPRREAGGGEVALMAVITKAMGAFLVLVVIMLPHYTLVVNNSQSADKAQAAVDQASSHVNEIADLLKKGRLTDQEIDELLRKIETLKKELAALTDEVARLKSELNQVLAEVGRLKKAKEALEAQVAELEKELEELRKNVKPATQFVASWSNCPGADIQLYVWSSAKIEEGGKSESRPPVSRTLQKPLGPKDTMSGTAWSPVAENGHVVWRMLDNAGSESFIVWIKLANPLSLATSRARICPVSVSMTTATGRQAGYDGQVTDDAPFVLALSARKDQNGGMNVDTLDSADKTPYRAIYASGCEGLMCFAKGNPAPEADRTKIKAAFTADIRQRIDVEESVIGKVFDTIASGDITIADGFRWLGLFPARNSAPSTVDPERLKSVQIVLKSMLERKRALPEVQSALSSELAAGRLDNARLFAALGKIRDGNMATLYDQFSDNTRSDKETSVRRSKIFDEISAKLRKAVDEEVAGSRLSERQRTIIQTYLVMSVADPGRRAPSKERVEARLAAGEFSLDVAAAFKELIQADVYSMDSLGALVDELLKNRRGALPSLQPQPIRKLEVPANLPPVPKSPAVKRPSSPNE